MQYFVTGATGFVGSQVVEQLVEAGHEVVALVREPARAAGLPDAVTLADGDITDRDTLREPMRGVDGVFHLAGWYRIGVNDPETAERVNVEGTRNVLEVMDDLDVPMGVYTSTLAVFSDTQGARPDESYRYDGPHLSVYDRTKWRAHYEVAEPMIADGLPLVIVMPGAVYGPGDSGPTGEIIGRYLDGSLPVIPRVSGYCWGHVEDIAGAHLDAMRDGEPGETYIIAGEPYTLVETFDLAERITGISAPRPVSPAVFRGLSRVTGALERFLPVPLAYRGESLRVLGGVTYWGDNAKARDELDLEHRSLETGLRETLEYELDRTA